jgi:hypothetical protein
MWKYVAFVLGLLAAPLGAQASQDLRGLSRTWMDLGQPSSQRVELDLNAAGVAITSSPDGHVRVRATSHSDSDLARVRVQFEGSPREAELRISDTPQQDFRMEIQLPRTTDLTLRMSAGEVSITGIEGDKDLRLHAGELRVEVGDPALYREVSASVWAGELRPGPFGETREGLFRRFHYAGPGRYRLQVRLKAGEVTFKR